MSSNDVLRITDIRRLSPQTISSSGYHSDLSSNNQSPQSIHDHQSREGTDKQSTKNFARLSCFLRKQYEKAKGKFLPTKQRSFPTIETCSKSTSTTALTNPIENHPIQTSTNVHQRSSFIEPVPSVYVPVIRNQPTDRQTHLTRRVTSYYQEGDNSHLHSHSYRRLTAVCNYENIPPPGYPTRHLSYTHGKPRYSQQFYPYQYLKKTSPPTRTNYVPLSDFISSRNSAFKPIQSVKRRSRIDRFEDILPSDDPCDLEVAQYFRHQTSQWSNPNYYDLDRKKDLPIVSTRKTYTETLC